MVYVVEYVRDITERIEAEQELHKATECFNEVLNRSADLLYRYNLRDEAYDYVSRSSEHVLGVPQQVLMAKGIEAFKSVVVPEDLDAVRSHLDKLKNATRKKPVSDTLEFRVRNKDNEERWLSERLTLIPGTTGGYAAMLGLVRDITERIKSEQHVRQALKEKDILLQEVHHRVKNNFQVITSLLNLSSKRITDSDSLEILRDMRSKIQSMSLIHAQIYQSERFDRIDMAAYVKKLFRHMAKMYQKGQITAHFELDPVKVSLDQAVPCGLVINECLTNAFRHAFQDEDEGEIMVTINREPEHPGHLHIAIRDNGRGFAKGFDPFEMGGMGFRIMQDLVEHQLGGNLDVTGDNGTSIAIRFPLRNGAQK